MLSSLFRPKLTSLTEQLQEPVSLCDVKKDIAAVTFDVEQEGMGEQVRPPIVLRRYWLDVVKETHGPNIYKDTKCRLYWCLIEFTIIHTGDTVSHVAIFDPSCKLAPL